LADGFGSDLTQLFARAVIITSNYAQISESCSRHRLDIRGRVLSAQALNLLFTSEYKSDPRNRVYDALLSHIAIFDSTAPVVAVFVAKVFLLIISRTDLEDSLDLYDLNDYTLPLIWLVDIRRIRRIQENRNLHAFADVSKRAYSNLS